jgi:hypothetical protein
MIMISELYRHELTSSSATNFDQSAEIALASLSTLNLATTGPEYNER